jgi:hypothetical protein
MPTTAERLAVAEGVAALGRELTKDEHKVAVACGQLFCAHIISQDDIIARLEATVLELRRMAG